KSSAEFEIVDRFACNEAHVVERFWHFAESCEVELQDGGAVSFDGSITLRLEVDERDATAILLRGCTDPISGWISRGFNRKSPTTTLVFRDEITGEAVLRTRIRLESSVLL